MITKQKFCVLTDSSSTFSFQKTLPGISVLPLNIIDQEGNEYDDKLLIQTIGERLEKGEVFRTSATPVGTLVSHVNNLLEQYEKVIYLSISSKISSQYSQMKTLRENFKDPSRFIIFDSQTGGYTLEILTLKVFEHISKNGFSEEKVQNLIDQFSVNSFNMFVCNSVKYIARSGRGGKKIMKYLSKLIRPVILFTSQNQLIGAMPTLKLSLNKMVKQALNRITTTSVKVEKLVLYAGIVDEEIFKQLLKDVSEKLAIKIELIGRRNVPKVVFVHTGPQTYGLSVVLKPNNEK